ncbi:TPA: hypothetical protein N0F65_006262 [Lagenidium giganteum]|uniref:Heterogeneous nuclear ribonucleoprotein Q acidic domain-containing protein n=1 Tax=Lagenidium giganteum TaxID=4803 RepID=A0AAV2Z0Y5_9STRA|nr:TPA: hypothetical protein N0F65_006262 [Lagenidium giganteum]
MTETQAPAMTGDGAAVKVDHSNVPADAHSLANGDSNANDGGADPNAYDPDQPQHNTDEYDPANPTHDANAYDPSRPSHDAYAASGEEYDPANPAMTQEHAQPTASTTASASAAAAAAAAATADVGHKRKSTEPPQGASSSPQPHGNSTTKRQRSSSTDEHKHGSHENNAARSNKMAKEDRKGLSSAAWDRLMDFQSGGEFRVTQVSRAALASVGALPEFAQLSIIARFTRAPMKDVRDKNGLLMKIFHEYQKENPHVASLQHASVYMDDYKADPGLYDFGYAPPLPLLGMMTNKLPYHKDISDPQPLTGASPRRRESNTSTPTAASAPTTDQFGRTVPPPAQQKLAPAPESRDPRRVRQLQQQQQQQQSPSQQQPLQQQQQPPPSQRNGVQTAPPGPSNEGLLPTGSNKPMDPRRRQVTPPDNDYNRQAPPAPAAYSPTRPQPVDPRRRAPGLQSPMGMPPHPAAPAAGRADRSEIFQRLPLSVQIVLDAMYNEGRLQEMINDSVLSRLLRLQERVALQAVENFSNVDLSHIENLQGFLVGIINRVNEKAIAAEAAESHTGVPSNTGGVMPFPTTGNASQPSPGQFGGHPQTFKHFSDKPDLQALISALPVSVQNHLQAMVEAGTLASMDEFGDKCYEVLGQLSEGLANEVLKRFTNANLGAVRNRSGFLIGVVKKCRQEYGFNG